MDIVNVFQSALESFAVGDAMGMPTEFLTREFIRNKYGLVETLLDPSVVSPIHTNLKMGQVTDDTEQVLWLINAYYEARKVDAETTLKALRMWYEKTNPFTKGFVGPSTSSVLSGQTNVSSGTTCGAAMRILAVSLAIRKADVNSLRRAIFESCLCTHNSNIAIEAAMALGYAYHYAAAGASYEEILEQAIQGARVGREIAACDFVGAHTCDRIKWGVQMVKNMSSVDDVLDFIYKVIGTTMEANEVVPAAVLIFAYARENTWLAIRMGASVGGDTDTIAAIAGALSALHAKNHNIPENILDTVLKVNQLDFRKPAKMLSDMFSGS